MLIGHYAPAFVLHRARPSMPLWVLFVAAQAVDVLWGVFVLTGVEHVRMVPGSPNRIRSTSTTCRSRTASWLPSCGPSDSRSYGARVIAAVVWWQRRDNRRPRAAFVLGTMAALLVASFYIPAPPTPAMMALTGLATYVGCAFAAWWARLKPGTL